MIKFLKIDGQKIDPLDYTLNIIKKYPDVRKLINKKTIINI